MWLVEQSIESGGPSWVKLVQCQATLGVARPRVGWWVVVLLGVWLSVFV